MNTIHQHRMKFYVDGCRVLHPDPGSIAPCHWKLSPKPSPAAIQKDGCRAFAFQILDLDEAIDYLRQRHCCGILFTSEPIQFGAFPSGWAWINNDALPPGEVSWAARFAFPFEHRGVTRVLGPDIEQDGAKLSSSTGIGVPYGTPRHVVIRRNHADKIAKALGAHKAWT